MRIFRLQCVLAGLLCLAADSFAETDAMYALQLVRQNGCGGGSGNQALFVPSAELGDAARALSDGASLGDALDSAGYLAKSAHSIYLRNTVGRAAIASVLSRQHCDIVSDPGLEEAGTYTEATETWFVLAERLISEAASKPDSATNELLDLVNAERAVARRCGGEYFAPAPPLRRVVALDDAAARHATDMASRGELTHRGADGSMPGDRVTRSGYRWAEVAENVAADQTEPSAVVRTWLESPPHCSTLMDPLFSETGLALASGEDQGGGIYWVQVYAAPR